MKSLLVQSLIVLSLSVQGFAQPELLVLMSDGVSYTAETLAYQARVEGDGGEIINLDAVNRAFLSGIDSVTLWGAARYGVEKDGDNKVLTAYDLMGNTDLTYYTADINNAPTYTANQINSYPSIVFDGTNDALSKTSVTLSDLVLNTVGTLTFVLKQDGTQANNQLLNIDATDNTNEINLYVTYSNTIYFDYGDENSGGRVNVAQPTGWDNTYHVIQFVRNGAAAEIWVDGTRILNTTFSDNLDNSQSGLLRLGVGGAAQFKGGVAEYIITNGVNSASTIRTFLANEYGL